MPRPLASRTAAPPSSFHQAQAHGAPQSGYSSQAGQAPQAHGYMPGQYVYFLSRFIRSFLQSTSRHQAMSGSHMNTSSNYASYGGSMVHQSSQGSSSARPAQYVLPSLFMWAQYDPPVGSDNMLSSRLVRLAAPVRIQHLALNLVISHPE